MASRNQVHEVLALRLREVPSGARVLSFLSAEAGILDAFVFGGAKSKLRSLASPFHSGRAYFYHDPVRDFLKLSDFDVVEAYPGLRSGLRKSLGASLLAELLIKTSGGGGDFPEVLSLARSTLFSLATEADEKADYSLAIFIWRLVGILGLLPDLGSCAACGRTLREGEPRLWRLGEEGMTCASCAGDQAGVDQSGGEEAWLSAGASRWIERAANLDFHEALAVGLDSASRAGLRRLVFALARHAAEGPLEALRTAEGIL